MHAVCLLSICSGLDSYAFYHADKRMLICVFLCNSDPCSSERAVSLGQLFWLRPPPPDSFSEALLKPRGSPAVEGHKQALPDLTLRKRGARNPGSGGQGGKALPPSVWGRGPPRARPPPALCRLRDGPQSAQRCVRPLPWLPRASRPCCWVLCLRSPQKLSRSGSGRQSAIRVLKELVSPPLVELPLQKIQPLTLGPFSPMVPPWKLGKASWETASPAPGRR